MRTALSLVPRFGKCLFLSGEFEKNTMNKGCGKNRFELSVSELKLDEDLSAFQSLYFV